MSARVRNLLPGVARYQRLLSSFGVCDILWSTLSGQARASMHTAAQDKKPPPTDASDIPSYFDVAQLDH
jgi:hypothetical protein